MRLGPLRHNLRIEQKVQSQDPVTGAVVLTWSTFAVVKGSIDPLSVKELIAAKAVQSELSARIKIRYISGLDASMRLVNIDTGDIYVMDGPPMTDPRSGRHWLTLLVSQGIRED